MKKKKHFVKYFVIQSLDDLVGFCKNYQCLSMLLYPKYVIKWSG